MLNESLEKLANWSITFVVATSVVAFRLAAATAAASIPPFPQGTIEFITELLERWEDMRT